MSLQSPQEVTVVDAPWVVLADPRSPLSAMSRRPAWWMYARVAALTGLVVLLVAVVAATLSRQEAQRESAIDATQRAVVIVGTVVQPSIGEDILTGSPDSTAVLDAAVRRYVLIDPVVRVKLWDGNGRIVYSDEQRLIGQQYPLDPDERRVLVEGARPEASVTDASEPENRYELGSGKLLEVYSRVTTPSGTPLLFETYFSYDGGNGRVGQIWRGFAYVTYASIALLLLLLLPVIWQLVVRLRRTQEEREMLLVRAAEISTAERRRIAATLHDGVVQDLAGTAFVLSGAATSAEGAGQTPLAASLKRASEAVRSSIGGLRSLLVEIYPPSLSATGLDAVLLDLVEGPTTRGLEVQLELPEANQTPLDRDGERLIFRLAQECLRNVARHAAARHVAVRLRDAGGSMVLSVTDDGIGFDPEQVLQNPRPEQYGLRLMVDDARAAAAELRVRSAPGQGTQWELKVAGR
jgi:two-component system, NarL family, sensor kinase